MTDLNVILTKDDGFGGEAIIAHFRLWTEADATAKLITADVSHRRKDFRVYVTDNRGGRGTRWTYQNGADISEQLMMEAGGEFPIAGEAA